MTWSQLALIECEGPPRDMGGQYGEQAREAIRYNETIWAGPERTKDAQGFLKALREFLRGRGPELLEEMTGIAEGSGVSLDSILMMNQVNTFGETWEQECTSMALGDTPDGPVLGKNNDGSKSRRMGYVIRKSTPESGLPMIQVAYAGWLSGLDAMNAAGLVNGHNSVGSAFDKSGRRLDIRLRSYQLMRHCQTTRQFLEGLSSGCPLTGKGFNIVLVDKSGHTAVVEAAVPHIAWRDLDAPFVYATNHYVTPALKDSDRRTPQGKEVSVYRLGYLAWRDRTSPPRNAEDIKGILRSHEPWAPCRHGGAHVSDTEWSLVGLPRDNKLLVAEGNPCDGEYAAHDVASAL